jgi:molybdenum cofactor biosynthesis protein B
VSARVATFTCSDTRAATDDASGARMRELVAAAGHTLIDHVMLADDRRAIAYAVRVCSGRSDVDAIFLTGGTGLAPRDVTVEAVRPLLDKELDGFGEAFRRLSWDQVGARSVLSRALAGSRGETFIVALPGSTRAVELAVSALVLPLLPHVVDLLHGRTAHRGAPG